MSHNVTWLVKWQKLHLNTDSSANFRNSLYIKRKNFVIFIFLNYDYLGFSQF